MENKLVRDPGEVKCERIVRATGESGNRQPPGSAMALAPAQNKRADYEIGPFALDFHENLLLQR